MVNNVAVKVSNLSKEFLLGQDKTVSILKDVSLSVNYGSCYQWCKSIYIKRREAC